MRLLVSLLVVLSFSLQAFADDGPSMESLGFDQNQVAPNPKEQKVLEKRAHKLQLHQKLGLVTLALAAATAATAEEGTEAPESHEILGLTTGAFYFTTAYLSLTAPEPKEEHKEGWNMKVHKAMAFIHFPAMVLLPFAGFQASHAYRDGKKPSGLGKYKKDLAGAALGSMAVAALAVTIDF